MNFAYLGQKTYGKEDRQINLYGGIFQRRLFWYVLHYYGHCLKLSRALGDGFYLAQIKNNRVGAKTQVLIDLMIG
jgi:hypothetical protein